MAESDLAGWALRARKGDRAAFERMVQATARVVYAQVVGMVRDRQKAEDLTQETFVAAWKGMATLQNETGAMSWLLTLARNKTLDALKHERRVKRGGGAEGEGVRNGEGSGPLEEVADGGPMPGAVAERAEARERALRVLGELPEEYRRVLEMRYLGGAEYEVIREALGLTDGVLRGVLNRGMAMMRERMSGVRADEVRR